MNFLDYYKSLDLNKRINLKGIGAMLNPWLVGENCPYVGNIKSLQMLDINCARVLRADQITWTDCGDVVFFTINWNSPIRQAFDILNKTCKLHYGRDHSMYPSNSFDYLQIGTCNH